MLLYRKTASQLREQINDGVYGIGDLLPTEKQLMETFDVSRVTIRKAINELVTAGMVEKVQGSGTYVRKRSFLHSINSLKSGTELIGKIGDDVRNDVLEFSLIEASEEVQSKLQLQAGDKVYQIRRMRYLAERPWVYEVSWMPLSLFPDLNYEALKESKFKYVEEQAGLQIEGCFHEFLPVMPDEQVRTFLNIAEGEPIIAMTSLNRTTDGTLFDYSVVYNNSSEHRISIDILRG